MKKHRFLTILFLIFSSSIFGQTFGTVGTEWYYSEHAAGMCPGNCEYLHLKSVSDTIIDGQSTHKIIQTYYRYIGDTIMLEPIYLFEQLDTVFMWSFSKAKFLTTYIFNGNIGDTLTLDKPDTIPWTDTIYRLVIDTIINVNIDGVSLKKYRTIAIDDYTFWNGGYFMERIGGLDWFFPRAAIYPEAGGPIRCFSDAQIDTNFQIVACDYILYTSVNELIDNNDIEIYPNPTTGKIIIQAESIIGVEIMDITGKTIKNTVIANKAKQSANKNKIATGYHPRNYEIDLSSQPKGIYIIKITTDKKTITRKIIKQ